MEEARVFENLRGMEFFYRNYLIKNDETVHSDQFMVSTDVRKSYGDQSDPNHTGYLRVCLLTYQRRDPRMSFKITNEPSENMSEIFVYDPSPYDSGIFKIAYLFTELRKKEGPGTFFEETEYLVEKAKLDGFLSEKKDNGLRPVPSIWNRAFVS